LNHAIGSKFTSEQTSTTAATAGGGTLTIVLLNGAFTIKSSGITTPANMVIQIFNVVMA
jgi:hypothetical protein